MENDPNNSETGLYTPHDRMLMATMVLQGLVANPGGPIQGNPTSGTGYCNCNAQEAAKWAVELTDALLAELTNEPH